MKTIYDATGRKWKKENTIEVDGVAQTKTILYADGMEFEETADHPLRLASINGHEDGRSVQVYDQAVGGDIATRAEYYHKDHLGNVRLTFSDLNQDGALTVRSIYDPTNEILLEKNYYPFGLEQTGPWFATVAPDNAYRYNGKELDEATGLYDYGARYYDPAVARWGQVDPLADQYAPFSPYSYVANNPILLIDPDGMRIIIGGQEWTSGATYDGDADSFAARMFGMLNNIASKSGSGSEWLNELKGSEFEFRIELDNEGVNRFDPDNKPEIINDSNGIPMEATIPEPGGGTLYINELTPSIKNTEAGPEADLEATLGHELIGHGIDAKRGQVDRNWPEGLALEQAEYSATERENVIRAEMGKPLRIDYTGHPTIRKTKDGVRAIPSGNLIRESRRYKKQ